MKKTFLVTSLFIVAASFGFSQTGEKGIRTQNANNTDEQLQKYVQQTNTPVKIEEEECVTNHSGTILFYNQTGKEISMDVIDVKGETVTTVKISKENSVYVKNIDMGEYYYYKTGASKKSKKKNMVNVIECTLKTIILDAKSVK